MELSVIIPTYNRANTLRQCLEYLQKQNVRGFEVIVVDDGSTDETKKIVEDIKANSWLDLHYSYQKNQKQGIARNLGIKKAQGEIILFLGDDILALPNLIENHLMVHRAFPFPNIAVLGYTTWAPFLEINDYMKFLESSGLQFHYNKINNLKPFTKFEEYKTSDFKGKFLSPKKQYWFFYTSNISLKKAVLLKECFDVNFKAYGWEDIELGLRLTKKEDLHLYYNPEAEAYHSHLQQEDELKTKMKTLATSLQFAPQLKPKRWKILLFKIIFNRLTMWLIKKILSKEFYLWAKAKKLFYKYL